MMSSTFKRLALLAVVTAALNLTPAAQAQYGSNAGYGQYNPQSFVPNANYSNYPAYPSNSTTFRPTVIRPQVIQPNYIQPQVIQPAVIQPQRFTTSPSYTDPTVYAPRSLYPRWYFNRD